MSRIGKKPVVIPKGVSVKVNKNEVTVKGPKGEITKLFHPDMAIKEEDGHILVERPSDMRQHRALHGLTRALINNMVVGVSEGFSKRLVITGVGYRAEKKGKDLVVYVGFSHPVNVPASPTITFDLPDDKRGTEIIIRGIHKDEVGQVASEIRKLRPPEPYKGKGIAYSDEVIRRKAGKSGAKKK